MAACFNEGEVGANNKTITLFWKPFSKKHIELDFDSEKVSMY